MVAEMYLSSSPGNWESGRMMLFMRGREALAVALRSLNIGNGDEVILQGFTCLALPAAILAVGAVPVYADIDGTTLGLTAESVCQRLTARTRAVVAQHTFGRPCDIERICARMKQHDIPVIEDCAHTLPYGDSAMKLGGYGAASFYSTEWAKVISTGRGGILRLNDESLFERVRESSAQYPQARAGEILQLRLQYYAYNLLARPRLYWSIRRLYRAAVHRGLMAGNFSKDAAATACEAVVPTCMSPWQRARLAEGLARAEARRARRIQLAKTYSARIRDLGIWTWSSAEELEAAPIRLPLWTNNKRYVLDRAQHSRIELGDWFASVVQPVTGVALHRVGYANGECPIAEKAAAKVVNVMLHSRVGDRTVESVIEFLGRYRDQFLLSPALA